VCTLSLQPIWPLVVAPTFFEFRSNSIERNFPSPFKVAAPGSLQQGIRHVEGAMIGRLGVAHAGPAGHLVVAGSAGGVECIVDTLGRVGTVECEAILG
jgi:hypothetical protein